VAKWTLADIPPQQGRTFVVTGASSGIGVETARGLAAAGATVILGVRDREKTQRAFDGAVGDLRIAHLDLADLSSVRTFASGIDHLDVLINNAGVMATPFARTADGFELQFGTNHLGHFALTGLLLDRLADRVVVVGSPAHRTGRIVLDDLNWERRPYRRWAAYGQSKLANVMFAFELQRRLEAAGSAQRCTLAHPGYAATGLQGKTGTRFDVVQQLGNRLVAQSAAMGALPTLRAATTDVAGGTSWGPQYLLRGYPRLSRTSRRAHDRAVQEALWSLSEKLTDVHFR
jgi:NAD(P)-dependent dehydrogenase (short-subunit alcohol dehydrogenase family)